MPSYVFSTPSWSVSAAPQARFAFTRWSLPAGSIYQFYGWPDTSATLTFKDCQFLGGMVFVDRPSVLLTNCLIERTGMDFWDFSGASDLALCNNTFHGGYLSPLHAADGSWVARDNLFDKTWIPDYGCTLTNDYNAYTFTNLGRLWPLGPHDVVLSSSNITYQTGRLGQFFVPTNLATINAGSFTNSALAGFYHYTTTTNQVIEGTNRLDIGFHLVALNSQLSSPALLDTDGDTLADCAEDLDGDGVFDQGTAETNWRTYDFRNGAGTNGPGLVVFTLLK